MRGIRETNKARASGKERRVKAWAVLSGGDGSTRLLSLRPWGNGDEFQHPIFHSRNEARAWLNRQYQNNLKIVRCTVMLEEGK